MKQLIILTAIVILSYFGLTFLTQHLNPEVKSLDATVQTTDTPLNRHGLPLQTIGTFTIDRAASKAWLDNQEGLAAETVSAFLDLNQVQTQFTFDGESIWFINHIGATPVKILAQQDNTIKLQMKDPSPEHQGSNDFFLQWDKDGGIWYSNYSHLGDGERKLYRARYTKRTK